MERIRQINNLVIYKDNGVYIVKNPYNKLVYYNANLKEVENWCKSCTVYLKEKIVLNVKTPNLSGDTVICHGSKSIIKKPYFGGGEPDNDYGRGFYCVRGDNVELAKEWACSDYNNTNTGYVNRYIFNINGLSCLNLNDYDIINWVALTAVYRDIKVDDKVLNVLKKYYLLDISKYDFIVGWRCDDTFSRIVGGFVKDVYTAEAVAQAIKLGYLSNQIVLKSEKSFNNIKFIDYEKVYDFNLYRRKFQTRKSNADKGLDNCQRMNRNGKYISNYEHFEGLF